MYRFSMEVSDENVLPNSSTQSFHTRTAVFERTHDGSVETAIAALGETRRILRLISERGVSPRALYRLVASITAGLRSATNSRTAGRRSLHGVESVQTKRKRKNKDVSQTSGWRLMGNRCAVQNGARSAGYFRQ